jgi:hypothetical protein
MPKKIYKILSGALLAIGLVSLTLLLARATHSQLTQEGSQWSTDTLLDFRQGTLDGVDVWSEPGTVQLDHAWWPNAMVNDPSSQGRFAPSLSFALTSTNGTSETYFLAVWADERVEDHNPDIYFAHNTGGGTSWSSDVLVAGAHVSGRGQNTPDITVRAADESFWVVWQDDRRDDGDIYYATSDDRGASWSSATPVYTGTGTQHLPHIAPHGTSGYLYAVWEDEQTGDDGDIYLSRFNPDELSAWSTPVKVNDDSGTAEQREPNLAVDADGNVFAVWVDERERDEYSGDVYFSRWISGTTWGTWSADIRLSDSAANYATGPDIVAGPNGVLFATWAERVPTGPATYDFQIVVARSQDSGDTWSRSVVRRLYKASAFLASYSNPAIGVDLLERVYVAWLHSPDQQAATANVLFSISPDRGENWTEPRVLNQPSNKVVLGDTPALMADFGGQVAIAWQDYRLTHPQIFASGYPADVYLISGEYHSPIFDVGGPTAWGTITWTATITPDTGLVLATRVMTGAGAEWTDWVTHTTPGDDITHPSGRSIQYRAIFTSTGGGTPVLDKVVISYEHYRVFLPLVLSKD